MSKNRIAAALRALTVAPSLESDTTDATEAVVTGDGEATMTAPVEEAQTTQAEVVAEDTPATGVVVEEDKGPEGIESAETEVSGEAPAVSTESTEESSVVTGDGEQTTVAKVEEAQTEQADVEGEDKPATGKVVEVDKGPEGVESAETTAEESEVITTGEVSQEGLSTATKAKIRRFFGSPLYTGSLYEKIEKVDAEIKELEEKMAAVKGAKAESVSQEGAKWEGVKADLKAGWGFMPDPDRPGKTKWKFTGSPMELAAAKAEELEKLEEKKADLEARMIELLKDGKEKVSQESNSDASAEAAAAFAAGAAGAAEAAAQATEEGAEAVEEVAAATEVTDVPAVVEEAAEEVAEAEAAAEVAESQAEAIEAEGTQVESTELPEEIAEQDEIDAGEAEMEELEADITEGEQHVEKFEQAAATLESLVDAISQAQQTGGLTPQAAQFMNIGFESVGVFLTGKPFTNARGEAPIPSMESFGGTMRRDQATSVSMESVQEWLQKVWEVLKKTFATIKDWIVKFFQAVFSQTERYKQRAAKIKAAADKLRNGAQPKNAEFQLSQSVANKIHMNGEISRWDLADLAELTKVAATRNAEGTRALMQVRQNLKDVATKLTQVQTEDPSELWKAILATSENLVSGELRNAAFNIPYEDNGQRGFKTKVLPGGVELAIVHPETEDNGFKAVLAGLRGWRVIVNKVDAEVKTEVRTLSGREVAQLAGNVEGILATIEKAKADFNAEALDIGNITIDADVSEDTAKKIGKVTSALGKAVQTQTSGTSKLFKYVVSTTGAYLDFAAASLKQYGEEVQDQAAATA